MPHRFIRFLPALLGVLLLAACARTPRPAALYVHPPVADEDGIPVLTWHAFADSLTGRGGNLTETYTRFEEMLRFLRDNGFRSVFPEEVRPGDDRRRLVVLTFDDGPRDHLRAAELLERYGFRGIFFVIPTRMRPEAVQNLTPDEVRRLARGGHRISAHGFDHRSLAGSGTEVAGSLDRSRGIIASVTDAAAAEADFAFPFGHYTTEVAQSLSGRFRYLHSVDPGYWDGRSALVPRILVMNDIDLAFFQDYVRGGAGTAPTWEPLFSSGGGRGQVAFRVPGGAVPEDVELFAISPDVEGRSYAGHPLGENLRVRGDTAWVDLAAHMRRWYPPDRVAVSYALVTRNDGRIRYLTPGLLHWIHDPGAMPAAPAR